MATAAAAVAVAVVALAAVVLGRSGDSPPAARIRISSPAAGQTVPFHTSVRGTVVGYRDYDLWLDVRGNAGDTHHPTETPCVRKGDQFSFASLYIGRTPPGDDSRSFTVSVIIAKHGSSGDRELLEYARRPADSHEFDGLAKLPAGVRMVESVAVVRGRN